MAVNYGPGYSAHAGVSVVKRILLACAVAILLLVLIDLLSGRLVDVRKNKVTPNQIVSPWDKSQIPPLLQASRISPKRGGGQTGPANPPGHHAARRRNTPEKR